MHEVTMRELRNHGGEVLDRVARRRRRGAGPEPVTTGGAAGLLAIALARDLPVYTGDPGDFAGIEGLAVVAVPLPD